MDNNTVTRLLTDYRSYKFALMNLKANDKSTKINESMIRPVYAERIPKRISRYDVLFDEDRYERIITMIESAVEYVLNDDQQFIIKQKYMNRNTMTLCEIADTLHKDRGTVSSHHKKAINKLAKALLPISEDYMEITNFDHMFDSNWVYREPA